MLVAEPVPQPLSSLWLVPRSCSYGLNGSGMVSPDFQGCSSLSIIRIRGEQFHFVPVEVQGHCPREKRGIEELDPAEGDVRLRGDRETKGLSDRWRSGRDARESDYHPGNSESRLGNFDRWGLPGSRGETDLPGTIAAAKPLEPAKEYDVEHDGYEKGQASMFEESVRFHQPMTPRQAAIVSTDLGAVNEPQRARHAPTSLRLRHRPGTPFESGAMSSVRGEIPRRSPVAIPLQALSRSEIDTRKQDLEPLGSPKLTSITF